MNKTEKSVEHILVKYDDGTEKRIEKGFIADFNRHENEGEITFEMVRMAGKDLESIVYACTELGVKLGMFGKEDENE